MSTAVNVGSPGVANRIKTYVSCLGKYDRVLTTKGVDAYIFDNIEVASFDEIQKYDGHDFWRLTFREEEKEFLKGYKNIDLLYENTPKYFIGKFKLLFLMLKINQDIQDYVNDFTDSWDDVIGLHIRSWYCDRRRYHSNKLFEDAIDALDKDKKIFLCGDNDDVLKHFEDRYGSRIITHPQERFNHPHKAESGLNPSFQTNVDAFIDLLCLSKCETIVGTYASTFTEVAWWFGKCKPKVIIPEPPNVDESFKNRIFEKL